jgi:hypothetical protein
MKQMNALCQVVAGFFESLQTTSVTKTVKIIEVGTRGRGVTAPAPASNGRRMR